jgi:hypothetical protein
MCGRLRVGKSFLHVLQHWSVQPCVRPSNAVHMTAGHNALRGSGPGHKPAFENNALAQVGCPDRRIDRLCITCCSPSQPSHHAGCPTRSRLPRKRDGFLVALAFGHHGPGHPRNLVGKRDGGNLCMAPHIPGTLVPVEEPSTASATDSCTAAKRGIQWHHSCDFQQHAQQGADRQPTAPASENSGDPKDRLPAKSLSPSFQKGSVSVVIFGSPSSR